LTETGGARLKQAIHVARAKAGIASDVQLAQRAHVSYDTLMNWYGGKTVPRGHELEKVASATGTSLWVLQAAYEGRAPEPPPLQDTVRDLVGEIRLQTEAINALVGRLDVLTEGQATAAGEMMRALGILGGRLAPRGTQREGAPEARDGTAQ
jgi:transcriptional regulator with XRE-family HTH domain